MIGLLIAGSVFAYLLLGFILGLLVHRLDCRYISTGNPTATQLKENLLLLTFGWPLTFPFFCYCLTCELFEDRVDGDKLSRKVAGR